MPFRMGFLARLGIVACAAVILVAGAEYADRARSRVAIGDGAASTYAAPADRHARRQECCRELSVPRFAR